jgi:hypothetical protein
MRIGDDREEDRGGTGLRLDDLKASFALGGNGVSGEGVCGGLLKAPVNVVGWEAERFGEAGQGERGLFGDRLSDFFRAHLLGDLESDRRRDFTAEVTSTWWTCVGEGRVNVPPFE